MPVDFRNYIYVSQTKLDQYMGQIDTAELSKVDIETKFKTPVFEHSVKTEFDSQRSRYKDIQTVVRS
jgi:hypothetical protein